jgi:hypothetical protein
MDDWFQAVQTLGSRGSVGERRQDLAGRRELRLPLNRLEDGPRARLQEIECRPASLLPTASRERWNDHECCNNRARSAHDLITSFRGPWFR